LKTVLSLVLASEEEEEEEGEEEEEEEEEEKKGIKNENNQTFQARLRTVI